MRKSSKFEAQKRSRRSNRDEFSQSTIDLLAKRVAYRCSRRECGQPTIGPAADGGASSIGVAAHITAAAQRGPRYDKALTASERSSADNGIWLCQSCSRMVDVDPARYTAIVLRDWKSAAERRAELEKTHRAIPDVAADIAALELDAERMITRERAYKIIFTPDAGALRVNRSVVHEVVKAAWDQSLLVVSEAGAGKTSVLLDVAEKLRAKSERVVFLDATDGRLREPRSYFGLTHSLEEVLQRWAEGERPGFLIIDGLDAMRSSPSFDTLLRLIRDVRVGPTPWRVIAATRDYDLESALQLQELFPALETSTIPDEFRLERFPGVSHIAVGSLTDAEIEAVTSQSPAFHVLWEGASLDLRKLLRNVFNLSIAARLTGTDVDVDLSKVRKRLELLELWWKSRIRGGAAAAQPEGILRSVSSMMLSRRELRLPIEDLQSHLAMQELLSDGVLVALGRYNEYIGFAHTILFDYATYRLCLRTVSLAEFLNNDRELALFALPSIRMRLAYLWEHERADFYHELRSLFLGDHRRTLLMAATRLIVECSASLSDVRPLLEYTDSAGSKAVSYLVRNLIYLRQNGLPIVGSVAGPWPALAQFMAEQLPDHEHDGLLVLTECLRGNEPTLDQRVALARAARLQVRRQLRPKAHEPVRGGMAISAFLKTYDVSPRVASAYLDRILRTDRISKYGRYDLQSLSFELRALHDPEALLAIYRAIFSDITVGSGKIDIGRRSAVMSMVQDASQTLSHARWALGERFAEFLREHPDHAVKALIAVLDHEARRLRRRYTVSVSLAGRRVTLVHDNSNIRDSKVYSLEAWYKMLREFEEQLRTELADGNRRFFEMALEELTAKEHGMHLWRLLFLHGGLTPESASQIAPLIASEAVLLAWELGEPVAAFLATGYARLHPDQRTAIDQALLALVHDGLDPEYVEYRRRRRDEFLKGMPTESIVMPALRHIAESVDDIDSRRSGRERELTLSGSSESRMCVSAPKLSESARRAGASDNLARAIDAARPLVTLSTGQSPPDGAAILPAIDRIEAAALGAPLDALIHAHDVICALVRTGLEHDLLSTDDHPRLMNLIDAAIAHPDPANASDDSDLDENEEILSWGSPWRFADGAMALGMLLRRSDEPRIVDSLRILLTHRRASVRNLAIQSAAPLTMTNPDVATEFAEFGINDRVIGVLQSGLNLAMYLNRNRPQTSRRLTCAAYDRMLGTTSGAEMTIRGIVNALVYFAGESHEEAVNRLEELTANPWDHVHLAVIFAGVLADKLAPSNSPGEQQFAQRMLLELVQRCARAVHLQLNLHSGDIESYPEDDRRTLEACLRILHNAAERIYFSSGAFDRSTLGTHNAGVHEIAREQFELLRPLLELLASIPSPKTAYHVIQVLVGAINSFPADSLTIAALAVRSAGPSIANDHFAEKDVRTFALRYIREHRGLLSRDPSSLAAVMDIVDAFVDAGWPQWLDVFVELDRVYRE